MTESHSNKLSKTSPSEAKQKRLSAALRANLIRRKSQTKTREELKKQNEAPTK